MRIFGKIMKVLLILCALTSIGLCVSAYASSSLKLAFGDDLDIREKIHKNTLVTLDNINEKEGLSLEHNYFIDEESYVEEAIHCHYKIVDEEKTTVCQWLEKVYNVSTNEDDAKSYKLINTSFVNGDNYIYSTDGTSKTKKVYSGKDFVSVIDEMLSLYKNKLNYIDETPDAKANRFLEYNVSLDFKFNTFKLYKNISYVKIENGVKTKINYVVDHKDRVSTIKLENDEVISFKYDNYKLVLPSTDGYTAE